MQTDPYGQDFIFRLRLKYGYRQTALSSLLLSMMYCSSAATLIKFWQKLFCLVGVNQHATVLGQQRPNDRVTAAPTNNAMNSCRLMTGTRHNA